MTFEASTLFQEFEDAFDSIESPGSTRSCRLIGNVTLSRAGS